MLNISSPCLLDARAQSLCCVETGEFRAVLCSALLSVSSHSSIHGID